MAHPEPIRSLSEDVSLTVGVTLPSVLSTMNDAVSGLPTGPALGQLISRSIALWKDQAPPIVLIGVEINHVGDITGAFGPSTWVALLREITVRLRDVVPENGTLFHVQTNMFNILLDGAHYHDATQLARRLVDMFEQPFTAHQLPITVEAHVGLASYPNHVADGDGLRQAASDAIRDARESHKPYAIYIPRSYDEQRINVALLTELKTGIASGQFELVYQPIVDLKTEKCVSFEALARWRHPVHGYISPGRFIPAAEKTSLIHDLSAWVARTAIQQLSRWRKEGFDLGVAMNLSSRDLGNRDFDAMIPDLLDYYAVPGESMYFEVTEGALMRSPNRAYASLNNLRRLGAQISIDDFGQAYSSLTYLVNLPATTIKIDQSFALNLAQEPKNRAIICGAISLAHDLGLTTVIEGVETGDIYQAAKQFGSDRAQGYFIAHPLPADEVLAWLVNASFGGGCSQTSAMAAAAERIAEPALPMDATA
jgi:EAL domain-containing protein (putative c-di-GMP-specific phosphodiesterase class I)/GGDEF domain-containing protein